MQISFLVGRIRREAEKRRGGKGRDNEARETGMASRREVGGYDSIAERNDKSGICDWWREGGVNVAGERGGGIFFRFSVFFGIFSGPNSRPRTLFLGQHKTLLLPHAEV